MGSAGKKIKVWGLGGMEEQHFLFPPNLNEFASRK